MNLTLIFSSLKLIVSFSILLHSTSKFPHILFSLFLCFTLTHLCLVFPLLEVSTVTLIAAVKLVDPFDFELAIMHLYLPSWFPIQLEIEAEVSLKEELHLVFELLCFGSFPQFILSFHQFLAEVSPFFIAFFLPCLLRYQTSKVAFRTSLSRVLVH